MTIRLIDADWVLGHLKPYEPSDEEWSVTGGTALRLIHKAVDNAPTVDAVVVTRCKECEHAERYERTDGTVGYYCGHPQNTFTYGERWDRVFKPVKKPDDFCSYGEPKEGAE